MCVWSTHTGPMASSTRPVMKVRADVPSHVPTVHMWPFSPDGDRFNAEVSSGLKPGGCWLVGQRATVGDANCAKTDPFYSYEGYLREVSVWTVVLSHARVGAALRSLWCRRYTRPVCFSINGCSGYLLSNDVAHICEAILSVPQIIVLMNRAPLRTDASLALALTKVVQGSGGEASIWVDDSNSKANATFLGKGVPTAFFGVGT
jgi:hypothetical protein